MFVVVNNFRGADASVSSRSEIVSAQNLTVSDYRDSLDRPASIPEIFERRTRSEDRIIELLAITRITRTHGFLRRFVEARQAKTVTLCGRQRARRTLFLSRTLETRTGRRHRRKRGKTVAWTFYIRGHALQRRIVTGAQRGCNFDDAFSLKQLSIGFPLEPPSLPPASTMPETGSAFRSKVKWPMNGKREGRFPNETRRNLTL